MTYIEKLNNLIQNAPELLNGGVHNVAVRHDSWCRIFTGRECNCEPEIEVMTPNTVKP